MNPNWNFGLKTNHLATLHMYGTNPEMSCAPQLSWQLSVPNYAPFATCKSGMQISFKPRALFKSPSPYGLKIPRFHIQPELPIIHITLHTMFNYVHTHLPMYAHQNGNKMYTATEQLKAFCQSSLTATT
jgi:hypothetical protein